MFALSLRKIFYALKLKYCTVTNQQNSTENSNLSYLVWERFRETFFFKKIPFSPPQVRGDLLESERRASDLESDLREAEEAAREKAEELAEAVARLRAYEKGKVRYSTEFSWTARVKQKTINMDVRKSDDVFHKQEFIKPIFFSDILDIEVLFRTMLCFSPF